jgi:hypothetical protein
LCFVFIRFGCCRVLRDKVVVSLCTIAPLIQEGHSMGATVRTRVATCGLRTDRVSARLVFQRTAMMCFKIGFLFLLLTGGLQRFQ